MASIEKGSPSKLKNHCFFSHLLIAHTDAFNLYAGKKKYLTAQEAVKAVRGLGVPVSSEEVLSAGLVFE